MKEVGQVAVINRVIQVGLIGKVTFNQRCEGGEGVSQANTGGKSIPCLHNSAKNPIFKK